MLPIQNLLSINRYSRPGVKLKEVKGVVIHWTANPNASAIANRNYFNNLNGTYASAHYVIGLQGEIIQCIPDNEIAYHAGSPTYTNECKTRLYGKPNYYTIGIELCPIDIQGRFNSITLLSCVELVRELCKKYNLDPMKDIWTHKEVVGWKDCPRWFVNNPMDLKKFKIAVQGYEAIIKANTSDPKSWLQFIENNKTGILQYLPVMLEKVYITGIMEPNINDWKLILKKCLSNPDAWINEVSKHKYLDVLLMKIFNA